MRDSPPTYQSGEEIRVGDHVTEAGAPGRVVFVIASRSFSPEHPEEQWGYLDRGFMIETQKYGLVLYDEANEDLILVERGRP